MSDRWRRRALTLLQWTLAVGALAYVLDGIDWGRTLSELAGFDPLFLLAVLVVTCFELGSRILMWYALIRGRAVTAVVTVLRIDLVIKFVNHVIPSKVSGHSVAPLVIHHFTDTDWSDSVSIAGVNVGLYATLYGLGAFVGLLVFAGQLDRPLLAVIVLSTLLYLAGGLLVISTGRRIDATQSLFATLEGLLGQVPVIGDALATLVGRLPSFTAESAAVFRDLTGRPSIVGSYALGWAFTRMVFPGLRALLIFAALGEWFTPVWLLPVALVTAYSVTVLPLTPGGIGVAEASATLVLVSLGVPEELAVTVIVVDRLFGVYLPAIVGVVPTLALDFDEVLANSGEDREVEPT